MNCSLTSQRQQEPWGGALSCTLSGFCWNKTQSSAVFATPVCCVDCTPAGRSEVALLWFRLTFVHVLQVPFGAGGMIKADGKAGIADLVAQINRVGGLLTGSSSTLLNLVLFTVYKSGSARLSFEKSPLASKLECGSWTQSHSRKCLKQAC